jgi:hypothetical protein
LKVDPVPPLEAEIYEEELGVFKFCLELEGLYTLLPTFFLFFN